MDLQLITGSQVRSARAILNWSQTDLADKSGVAIGSIRRIESKDGLITGTASTFINIVKAFNSNGVEFTGDTITSVGVVLSLTDK